MVEAWRWEQEAYRSAFGNLRRLGPKEMRWGQPLYRRSEPAQAL